MYSTPRRPLLLVGAGERAYCAHSLLQIAAEHSVVLVDRTVPPWARPYLAGAVTADPAAGDEVASSVDAFAVHHPIVGVVTYLPEHAPLTASLASRLGLPGNRPATVVRTMEPSWTRDMMVGSHNTDPAGCDVSLEAVLTSGEMRPIAVTRIDARPGTAASPTGYSIDAHDVLLHDTALHNRIRQALAVLGLASGVIHAELRISAGEPRLRHVRACLAGDLIPLLVARATGVSLARAAAALAAGEAPDLSPTHERAAALQFLYPDNSGRLGCLRGLKPSATAPWLDRFVWTQQTGGTMLGPPHSDVKDRLAHWVVTGADAAQCARRLGRVAEQVSARISVSSASQADRR